MKMKFAKLALATALGGMMSAAAVANELIVTFDDLNPDKKAAYETAIEAFKAANPDINVTANNGDREAHKNTIRNALQKVSNGDNSLPLTISADANARHQDVVTAMDVAGRLGFTQISIATVNEPDAEQPGFD